MATTAPEARTAPQPLFQFHPSLKTVDVKRAADAIGCQLVALPNGVIQITPRVK